MAAAEFRALGDYLGSQILGQDILIEGLLIALLCEGHVLIEGAPGLAKTRAVKALAGAVEGMDMLYSSGTTGRPKGVKVPLRDVPLGTPDALFMLVAGLFGANPDTVYLSPAPLYHAAPLRFCGVTMSVGGTVIMMHRFDPEEALARIVDAYRALAREHDVAFVLEFGTPDDRIVLSRKGIGYLRVAVKGKAAHAGAEPEKGCNAALFF